MESNKQLNILETNILYFLMAVLLLSVGTVVQTQSIISGLIITEYLLVLMPPLIYLLAKRIPIIKFLRLNKLRFKHGLLIIAITILSYPIALFFNLIVMTLLSTIGTIQQPPIPIASDLGEYFTLMAIIALSAGLCEEVFFRGMLMRGYESLGPIPAIFISAVLFGLFHFNIQNLAGPTVLGIIFGYLVYRTDSLFAGMIGHATNNGIAVTIGYLANVANNKFLQQDLETIGQMPGTLQMALSTITIGVVALVTGLCAFALLRIIIKDTQKEREDREEVSFNKPSVWVYTPVFLTIIIFMYIGYLQIAKII